MFLLEKKSRYRDRTNVKIFDEKYMFRSLSIQKQ